MAEVYTTLGQSALSSGYTSGGLSLVLTSGASFPSTGVFRVRVDNEIFRVSARSSGTLTVIGAQEGTSAANHLSGATCTEVVTALALDGIRADQNSVGLVSALPGSPKAGDQFNTTNGFYRYVFDGSIWRKFVGSFHMDDPTLQAFTWINQGGATVDVTRGGIILTAPASASDNLRIRQMAVPAAPYSITIKFWATLDGTNFANAGLVLRNSGTGELVTFFFSAAGGQMGVSNWNSPTSFNGAAHASNYMNTSAPFICLKLYDDNTNRNWFLSMDGGVSFYLFYQESRTSFITPDFIGFFADSNNSFDVVMSLLSWTQGVS